MQTYAVISTSYDDGCDSADIASYDHQAWWDWVPKDVEEVEFEVKEEESPSSTTKDSIFVAATSSSAAAGRKPKCKPTTSSTVLRRKTPRKMVQTVRGVIKPVYCALVSVIQKV
jgi:hypothetical protein